MSEPILIYDEERASRAWARYNVLVLAQTYEPSLADEECFQILLNDARCAFEVAFCAPNIETHQ